MGSPNCIQIMRIGKTHLLHELSLEDTFYSYFSVSISLMISCKLSKRTSVKGKLQETCQSQRPLVLQVIRCLLKKGEKKKYFYLISC